MNNTNNHDHAPPLEYMLPYQPSRNNSLASFGVVPDDIDGIFLAPRRRRKHRKQGRGDRMNTEEDATNGESYEDEDCMEVWDSTSRMTGSSGGGGGGGEGVDGSLATSSSIPSIRMAARLNSSTTMYEEDTSLCGTYDGVGGGMGFDMESGGGGASFFGVPAYSAATSSRGGSNGGVVEDGYAIHVDHTSTPMSNTDGFLLAP